MKKPAKMLCLRSYRFPREVVAFAVWIYHWFAQSAADVVELLAGRGIIVRRETVREWVNRFGRHVSHCTKRDRAATAGKWHLDEADLPINGANVWLCWFSESR